MALNENSLKALDLTTKKEYDTHFVTQPEAQNEELYEKQASFALVDGDKNWKYYLKQTFHCIGRAFYWIFLVIGHTLRISWVVFLFLFRLAKKILFAILALCFFLIRSV